MTMQAFMAQLETLFLIYWQPVAKAVLILVVAHFVAKAVKWAIAKAVDRIPFFARRESLAIGAVRPHSKLGERVGEVGYWIVWLLGLILALTQLGMTQIIAPLNDLAFRFLGYVPNVVGALLIFLIGFALATIVRRMVEALVQTLELDQRLVSAGLTHTPRGPGLARLLGILVFTLIIIPVSVAALKALDITSISDPAERMLNGILQAIPNVIGAALILFIAYLIGRWVATLTEEGLQSIGFDQAIRSITAAEPVRMGLSKSDPTPDEDSLHVDSAAFPPSRMAGYAVLVGIILFAAIEAAHMLGFTAMSDMLSRVLDLATSVLFGAIIITVGVVIANILSAAVGRREDGASSEIMSVLVRWGVIALAAAMGLRFMGIANDIITLAFGLLLGSVAVAVAIAFGVGGRDAAQKLLARWTK